MKTSKIKKAANKRLILSQLNNPSAFNIKLLITNKENINDCLKAILTELKTKSRFKITNLDKKPSKEAIPLKKTNKEE
jgi:hypothetical protein